MLKNRVKKILKRKFNYRFIFGVWVLVSQAEALSQVQLQILKPGSKGTQYKSLAQEIRERTSIALNSVAKVHESVSPSTLKEAWLWVTDIKLLLDIEKNRLKSEVLSWIRKGGFLIVEFSSNQDPRGLKKYFDEISPEASKSQWQVIPPDHELMRSFYLLDNLPSCHGMWMSYQFDQRTAVLALPSEFLSQLQDHSAVGSVTGNGDRLCSTWPKLEYLNRTMVNLLLVVLTTDYKKDQIHLPEILKRIH